MSAKPPRAVKIGYKKVALVPVERLLSDGDRCAEYHDGRDGTNPRIEYEQHLHGRELAATLIHEIHHALCEMHIPAGTITAMPHDAGKIEEVYVDALSVGLVIFLSSNRAFGTWFWETIYE